METIKVIACPMEGCDGKVHAAWSAMDDDTGWEIVRFDADPIVLCSRGCSAPEELVGPVEAALRAGMSAPGFETP